MSDDDIQSTGKYFRVTVPDFATDTFLGDPTGSRSLSSYLRLGAVPTVPSSDPPRSVLEPGTDLAVLVQDFVDDTRLRDAGAPTVAARQAESDKLHTRGGWLDHSDGNRVTTTRGDKIEVIRGNYKMVVLGRHPVSGDPTTVDGASGGTTSWDSSGGHIQDWRVTPGAVTEIRWVESRGTWKLHEKTEKGDVHSIYNGEVREEFYGPSKVSITGTETPGTLAPETNPNPLNDFTVTRENPSLTERTWATKIESFTGSATLPVPEIKENTWATSITSETVAGIIDESTLGNTVSKQIGTSSSMLLGNDFSFLVGASENIHIGAALDVFLGLKKLGVDISGNLTSVNVAVTNMAVSVAAAHLEVRVGPKQEVATSNSETLVLGTDTTVCMVARRVAAAIFLG